MTDFLSELNIVSNKTDPSLDMIASHSFTEYNFVLPTHLLHLLS